MTKPVDMAALRRAIEDAPAEGRGATVSRDWLVQVEQELRAGRAAQARLAMHDATLGLCEAIERRARGG